MNYATEYHDIHDGGWEPKLSLRDKFCGDLMVFLAGKMHIEHGFGTAIARSLFERMSSVHLHYHTPYHIVQIFEFAKMHGIALEPWEELAVWFHDSVYWPGTGFGVSEDQSGNFMSATLPPDNSPEFTQILTLARGGIEQTARHLEAVVPERYHRLLDLDINIFCADTDMLKQVNTCLQRELCPDDTVAWARGRTKFLRNFMQKGFVFRSPEFQRFENDAAWNIGEEIEQNERIISG